MMELALFVLAVISCCSFINANESLTNISAFTLEDKDSIQISLFPESEDPIKVSEADKAILRYGFQRTHDCHNFEKAFLCIRKCLDLDYQIAHADKNCICTCYKNTVLAQYKPPKIGSAKWKLGAPTTNMPPWAGKGEPKPDDYEINANYTEFVEDGTTKGGLVGGAKEKNAKTPKNGKKKDAAHDPKLVIGETSDEEETSDEGVKPAKGETLDEGKTSAEEEALAEAASAEKHSFQGIRPKLEYEARAAKGEQSAKRD